MGSVFGGTAAYVDDEKVHPCGETGREDLSLVVSSDLLLFYIVHIFNFNLLLSKEITFCFSLIKPKHGSLGVKTQ